MKAKKNSTGCLREAEKSVGCPAGKSRVIQETLFHNSTGNRSSIRHSPTKSAETKPALWSQPPFANTIGLIKMNEMIKHPFRLLRRKACREGLDKEPKSFIIKH